MKSHLSLPAKGMFVVVSKGQFVPVLYSFGFADIRNSVVLLNELLSPVSNPDDVKAFPGQMVWCQNTGC